MMDFADGNDCGEIVDFAESLMRSEINREVHNT
ncbi:MAG: hypothetical protein JWP89_6257 [Schlesneria sp.]|nr:hypothetical protein [Schlesneria sp.]